jgi:PAS domain S-box-containing protein
MAVIILSALTAIAWRNRTVSGAAPFALVMIALSQYIIGTYINTNISVFREKLFWSYYYVSAAYLFGLAWFVMALKMSGYRKRFQSRVIWLMITLSAICLGLMVTNSYHGWYMRDPRVEFNQINGERGFAYWLLVGMIYLLIGWGTAIFGQRFLKTSGWRRRQAGVMFAGALPGLATAVILTTWRMGHPHATLPLGLLLLLPLGVTVWIFSWGALRLRFFDIMPMALTTATQNMGDGLVVIDQNDYIIELNSDAQKLLGGPKLEITGDKFTDAFRAYPRLAELAAKRETETVEDYLECGGERRDYRIHITPLVNRKGRYLGKALVLQDISVQKQAQAQLLEQQKALSVLTERERLSRELHDSMGQVLGYVNIQIQNIRDKLNGSREGAVEGDLVRLSQVVEEANTEIREFISEVKSSLLFKEGFFASLKQYLERFQANFQIPVALKNPECLSDQDLDPVAQVQLFRIIQEALANVRKHARATAVTVCFTNEAARNLIRITVVDNGIGFKQETSKAGRHFGLEIMSERAVHAGGKVRVDSAPGWGTQVIIELPAAAKQPQTESSGGELAAKSGPLLLVDDHFLFLEGLQKLLESRGFLVAGIARDGLEALEKAQVLRPAIILMDLQMPGCDGLAATRLIKAKLPETKIVILTMSDREEDLFEAIRSGACGYLLKGLRAEELIKQLNGLAGGEMALSPGLAAKVMREFHSDEVAAVAEAEAKEPAAKLTPKQAEVLGLIAGGLTYKEVAARLGLSERTVKYHMGEILERLHLKNRNEVELYARKMVLGRDKGEFLER